VDVDAAAWSRASAAHAAGSTEHVPALLLLVLTCLKRACRSGRVLIHGALARARRATGALTAAARGQVRDLYWTVRNFRQRVLDFLRYRRVTANLDERFQARRGPNPIP